MFLAGCLGFIYRSSQRETPVMNGFLRAGVGRNEKQVAMHQIFGAKGATCHPAAVVFQLFSCSQLFEAQRTQFGQDCLSVATSWHSCKLTVVALCYFLPRKSDLFIEISLRGNHFMAGTGDVLLNSGQLTSE